MTREKLIANFNKILDLNIERLAVYVEAGKAYSAYKTAKTVKEADKARAKHERLNAKYERLSSKQHELEEAQGFNVLKYVNTEAGI